MKVLLLKTNGSKANTSVSTFTDLQALVGGLVECAGRSNGRYILVNEEGLIHRLPSNPHLPHLVGNVVLAPEGWDELPYGS